MSSNSDQGFPADRVTDFLKLGPELRDNIYDNLCVKPTYIGSERNKTFRGFQRDAAEWRNLAFATSCRQIYEEISHVFYARNGFEFGFVRPFLEFLEGIGLKGRKSLTKVRFMYVMDGTPFVALRYLKSCKNLQKLEIYIQTVVKERILQDAYFPMKKPLGFFLRDWDKIEFGQCQKSVASESSVYSDQGEGNKETTQDNQENNTKYDIGIEDTQTCATGQAGENLLKSLILALKKIKTGDDKTWKGNDLPDIFAERGSSSAYLKSLPSLKTQSEITAKIRQRQMKKLEELDQVLKSIAEGGGAPTFSMKQSAARYRRLLDLPPKSWREYRKKT